MTMSRQKGFTLIELLVVIAILALLMSILMPALSKAKGQAKAAICLSNLHQWSIVWTMYLDNNNSFFPNRNDWPLDLRPYYMDGNLRLCPGATKPYVEGGRQPFASWGPLSYGCEWPEPETSEDNYTSYGFNEWVCHITDEAWAEAYRDYFWRTCNVKGGAYVPMFMDCSYFSTNPFHDDDPPAYEADVILGLGPSGGELKRFCVNRHYPEQGLINGLFLDFSGRKVGLKELWELRWHRDWNPGNDPPPDWETEAPWMAHMKDYWLP